MGLLRHDVEACVRDFLGDKLTEARRKDDIKSAGEHERWCGDPSKAVRRVVREAGVDLCLKGLDGLLGGKASAYSMIWSTKPSACARGV